MADVSGMFTLACQDNIADIQDSNIKTESIIQPDPVSDDYNIIFNVISIHNKIYIYPREITTF
jgi:hypothetical protein